MLRLLIPFLLLFVIDLYFFQAVRTITADYQSGWRHAINVGYWLLTFAVFIAIFFGAPRGSMPNHVRYLIFSAILVLYIPKMIGGLFLLGEDVFRVGSGLFNFFSATEEPFLADRRKFISKAGLIAAALPLSTMLYGMVRTAYDLRIRKQTLTLKDLPATFDGLKIAQISDLHSGSFGNADLIRKAVDKILELKPDLVFFTGDLVNNEAVEAQPFVKEFKRLKASLGVFSIFGNHDYGDYGPWPSQEAKAQNLEDLKDVHRQSGWNLLLNENRVIEKDGERITIVGVENWGASRHFPKYGDLDKAVTGVEDIPFKILLSHDPSHWDAQIRKHPQKFQLTLSGHTHGAQFGIEIPGFKWSPVQYIYKQWAGLYSDDDQHLYVNRGLGFIGYMGRIGITPEITLLELRSGNNV